jgi:hypothetical protein
MSLFSFFKKSEAPQRQSTPISLFYQTEQLTLPDNFAQTMMDLEMKLELVESCNIEVVYQLNELYRVLFASCR